VARILLTGFEPFGGSTINPSEQILNVLAAQGVDGHALQTAVLPVERQRGPRTLLAAVAEGRPDVVICLGEAGRRSAVSVEQVALNLLDYRLADNRGEQVVDELISPYGPVAYFSTLPVRAIVDALLQAGIPARVSLSAGAFLCNQVFYMLMEYLAEQDVAGYSPPAGFIHVPRLPAQAAAAPRPGPSMGLVDQVQAVRVAIDITVESLLS
jgi:pyroglutamyl-peptidase